MLFSKPTSGLSLLVMMLRLRSRRNRVRGSGSCSGSQSASRSRAMGSKRLGGLLPAPRAAGNGRLTVTVYSNSIRAALPRFVHLKVFAGRTLYLAPEESPLIFNRMANETLLQLDLPGVRKLKSGKVREVFDLGDRLLFVATDRISAFDCIMPNGIPRKGEVLTQLSYFWFDHTKVIQPNHLLSRPEDLLPANLRPYAAQLARRTMIVKKAQPLAIECVVRGYLAGSGWKEYREQQTVCGIKLPPGLKESSELPKPIFTPATKAESGHDENITFE